MLIPQDKEHMTGIYIVDQFKIQETFTQQTPAADNEKTRINPS